MTFTKERIIEELKDSTQNASGMFEINEDTICALMELLESRVDAETVAGTQYRAVADLYSIAVPGGRSVTYSTDAAEASDCRAMGWEVQEYVKLERLQDAYTRPQPAPVVPDEIILAIENLKQKLVDCNRYNYCSDAVKSVENACRAALLQGVQHENDKK